MKNIVLCILLAVALMSLSAATMWNEDVPVRKAYNMQWERNSVKTADDCVIVVWTDTHLGNYDIFAQKIDSAGQLMWQQSLAVISAPEVQEYPQIIRTSDNNFIVSWFESPIMESSSIHAQKFTSSGELLWGLNGTLIYNGGEYVNNFMMQPNNVGGAYFVWSNGYTNTRISGQSLGGSGNILWQENGRTIISSTTAIYLGAICADNQGGLLINYRRGPSNSYINYLVRIDYIGNELWTEHLILPTNYWIVGYQIVPMSSGTFYLIAYPEENSGSFLIQKMDNTGTMLLAEPLAVATTTTPGTNEIRDVQAESTPDGTLFLAWSFLYDYPNPRIKAQKISPTMQILWQNGGVDVDNGSGFQVGSLDMSPDLNGGSYLSWVGSGVEPNYNRALAQHVGSTGTITWQAAGVPLVPDSMEKQYPAVFGYSDRAVFIWNEKGSATNRLMRQLLSASGDYLLSPDAEMITGGLYGIAYLNSNIALGNKSMVFWSDTRHAYWGTIYYQIINSDASIGLETNGRLLSQNINTNQSLDQVLKISDNQVAVLYNNSNDENYLRYLQVIDSYGNPLYPGDGLLLSGDDVEYYGIEMSVFNGDLYLIWVQYSSGSNSIWGQRFSNGEKMWGENGKMLYGSGADIYMEDVKIAGRYIVWGELNISMNQIIPKALMFDINGDPAPGWTSDGMSISNHTNINYINGTAGLLGENLAIVYVASGRVLGTFAQLISPTGEYLWNGEGTPVINPSDSVYPQYISFNDGIYMVYSYPNGESSDLKLQKIDSGGNLLFGDTGVTVANDSFGNLDPVFFRFDNGVLALAWMYYTQPYIGYADLNYRYVEPDGTVVGPDNGNLLCNAYLEQRFPIPAVIGNEAIICWIDARAGILNSEEFIQGIYAQKINNEVVANPEEPGITPARLLLKQNFPNPFNPSTTISFTLAHQGQTHLAIYNLKGQLVTSLINEILPEGTHHRVWNGKDSKDKAVASGIYYYRLQQEGNTATHKMLLMK